LGIIRGLTEHIPDALRGCTNDSDGTHAKRHCLILLVWVRIPTLCRHRLDAARNRTDGL
jgi:hypothetical protein